jgi:hypothetical protein
MLTDAELGKMRAEQVKTMLDTATIGRRILQSDGAGGTTETFTQEESVCRIAASTNQPDYQMFAAAVNEAQLWRITFPAGTDVRKEDQILANGRTFEVLGVMAPATFETARVTICVER